MFASRINVDIAGCSCLSHVGTWRAFCQLPSSVIILYRQFHALQNTSLVPAVLQQGYHSTNNVIEKSQKSTGNKLINTVANCPWACMVNRATFSHLIATSNQLLAKLQCQHKQMQSFNSCWLCPPATIKHHHSSFLDQCAKHHTQWQPHFAFLLWNSKLIVRAALMTTVKEVMVVVRALVT